MKLSVSGIIDSLKKQTSAPPDRVVGIDIGSSSVKVVELENTERALTLRTYGELQLGPYADGALGDTVTLEEDKKVEALVDVIRESNVKATSGVLSMPLSSSFVTVIPMTLEAGETVETKIPVEARKYIPVPLPEVILEWAELPARDGVDTAVNEVLLTAVQTESLAMFNRLTQAIEMKSEQSDIEVFSTILSLRKPEVTTMAILDLGARVSKLYIVRDGSLERIHRVMVGGAAVTKKVSNLLDTSFEEAENIKRGIAPDDPRMNDLKKATQATLQSPLQEFKRIIDQYEARFSLTLDATVVVGGVARDVHVPALARDLLSRDVQIGNPFDRVAYPAFMEDTLRSLGPSFAVSLGAAERIFET